MVDWCWLSLRIATHKGPCFKHWRAPLWQVLLAELHAHKTKRKWFSCSGSNLIEAATARVYFSCKMLQAKLVVINGNGRQWPWHFTIFHMGVITSIIIILVRAMALDHSVPRKRRSKIEANLSTIKMIKNVHYCTYPPNLQWYGYRLYIWNWDKLR